MLLTLETYSVAVLYILIGAIGFICNTAILVMVSSIRVYHKSAYILMANIAIADAFQSFLVGCYTGGMILWYHDGQYESHNSLITMLNATRNPVTVHYSVSVLTINAWFVMIYSYAILGINRCIGTCFYKTKLRKFNRLDITLRMIVSIWVASLLGGFAATFPEPILFIQPEIYTMRFVVSSTRSSVFVWFNVVVNAISIAIQWACSTFVLRTMHQINRRVSNHTISTIKAQRSQRQARLSFQFFYPSVVCTLSSFMFFSMPFYAHLMTRWHFFLSHLVWLINHMCNPFIYAYFNERMRDTLRLWIRCRKDTGQTIVTHQSITGYPFSQSRCTTERRNIKELLATVRNTAAIGIITATGVVIPAKDFHKMQYFHAKHFRLRLCEKFSADNDSLSLGSEEEDTDTKNCQHS